MFVPLTHPPGHAQADFGEARVEIGGVLAKAHYLFEERFGRPGKGNDKGKVENLVKVARRSFFVPRPRFPSWGTVLTEFRLHATSASLAPPTPRLCPWLRSGTAFSASPGMPLVRCSGQLWGTGRGESVDDPRSYPGAISESSACPPPPWPPACHL